MFGNLIAAVALGHLNQYYYVVIVSIVCAVGILLLFFLRSPIVNHRSVMQKLQELQ